MTLKLLSMCSLIPRWPGNGAISMCTIWAMVELNLKTEGSFGLVPRSPLAELPTCMFWGSSWTSCTWLSWRNCHQLREEVRDGGREGGRKRGMDGGREEGGKERGREGGREGGREREGGRK